MSGRMGKGCLDFDFLKTIYKYWVGLERSRDLSNKDLRHLTTTANVIQVSEGADYNTMFGHSECGHSW